MIHIRWFASLILLLMGGDKPISSQPDSHAAADRLTKLLTHAKSLSFVMKVDQVPGSYGDVEVRTQMGTGARIRSVLFLQGRRVAELLSTGECLYEITHTSSGPVVTAHTGFIDLEAFDQTYCKLSDPQLQKHGCLVYSALVSWLGEESGRLKRFVDCLQRSKALESKDQATHIYMSDSATGDNTLHIDRKSGMVQAFISRQRRSFWRTTTRTYLFSKVEFDSVSENVWSLTEAEKAGLLQTKGNP